jgi:hypothetical protein
MKTEIRITPNRDRGYDATIYSVRAVRLSAFMRNLCERTGSDGKEREPMHTVNAPSEAKAREMAQAWIDAQPKRTRKPRALSESECETREAIANEKRAHG